MLILVAMQRQEYTSVYEWNEIVHYIEVGLIGLDIHLLSGMKEVINLHYSWPLSGIINIHNAIYLAVATVQTA